MTASPDKENAGTICHHPYYRTSELAPTLRGQAIRVITKPGLPQWDRVTPATGLLAEAVEVSPDARVLVLGCGPGALGVVLARQAPAGQVWLLDTSAIALAMAERTLAANGVANASVVEDITALPARAGACDVVAIELPKGRQLARRWLVEAHAALRPGGRLYLAGPKNEGVQSGIADLKALFGDAETLAYRAGNRVASGVKVGAREEAPAWARDPGIAPGTWHEFAATVRDQTFQLRSLPGIFSFEGLDAGTRLLLDHLEVPRGGGVLDIGCGYGIIGLLAARLGAGSVDLVDENLLAVAAAAENIAANGVHNARAFASDAFAAVGERRYDLVVTNPPFHTGKAVAYDAAEAFIAGARQSLNPGGRFMLVANRFIRHDALLRPLFARVETVAEDRSYHVLVAE